MCANLRIIGLIGVLILFISGCSDSTGKNNKIDKKQLHISVVPIKSQKEMIQGDCMTEALPEGDFKAKIEPKISRLVLPLNTAGHIPIRVTNLGHSRWSSLGPNGKYGAFSIVLSYHMVDHSNRIIALDGERFLLPDNLMEGESVLIDAVLPPMSDSGIYRVIFDMVQENVSWFKDKGSETAGLMLIVN